MRKRIFRGALVLALAASLLTGLLATVVYYRQSGQQLEDQLWQELDMLATLVERSGDEAFATLQALRLPLSLIHI